MALKLLDAAVLMVITSAAWKTIMAETEYFNVGMVVSCVTCHDQRIQGEVVAFDYQSKMLIIKSQPKGSKPNTHTVQFVNLAHARSVEVISESVEQSTVSLLPNLSFSKLNARLRTSIEEKMRKLGYVGIGVSSVGQRLVDTIIKTIPEVRWDNDSIIVMSEVTIIPPYSVSSCSARDPSSAALQHVRKLVDKFHKDNGEPPSVSSPP